MNKIKKTLFYLLSFAALLLIIMVVVNLSIFDEDLLPEVAAIKNIKAEPYRENNAYPALIAINSSSGPSLKAATQMVRDHLNQQIVETGLDYLTTETLDELAGGEDSSWKNVYHSCKSRTEKGCIAAVIKDINNNPIIDKRLISQLQRYRELIELRSFQEATQMNFDSPLIPYSSTLALKRIFLTDVYTHQSSNDYLSEWRKDAKFWRMVLARSRLLITRMVAIASVTTSIDSLSTAIKQGSLSPVQLRQLQTEIQTLNKAEIDMGTTFEFEFKYGMDIFENGVTDGVKDSFEEWLYQPRATHNTRYLHETKPLKRIAALTTADYYQYINSDQKNKDLASPVNWTPGMLYNPTGKLLVSYSIPAYTNYLSRAHDLNGMFYLLKLQIEIALSPDQLVENVIANSQYTNPYTHKPMGYKKETHSIYFECMDKTSVCELDL